LEGPEKGEKMSFQDETLTCKDCGKEFEFTAKEQEFYQEKGFENKPQRCKDCRIARKSGQRKEFAVVCAECGKDTTVPFEPKGDKPVYCLDCFRKNKE